MSTYAGYLRQMLSPLGVYALWEGSVSEGAIHALGTALDSVMKKLELTERESLTATAEEDGLRWREELFAKRPAAIRAEDRRAAIAALMQIDGDSLTPEAINRTLRGCGIRAEALEMDTGHLRVIFPEVGGVPEEFEEVKSIILDILPCHLDVEFYFLYLTWEKCEELELSWEHVEEGQHTWHSFELLVWEG